MPLFYVFEYDPEIFINQVVVRVLDNDLPFAFAVVIQPVLDDADGAGGLAGNVVGYAPALFF